MNDISKEIVKLVRGWEIDTGKKVKAEDILKETQLEESENLDLLKIELNYWAKREYKWDVYHTPQETKEFFKKLYKSLKDDKTTIDLGLVEVFYKFKEYNAEHFNAYVAGVLDSARQAILVRYKKDREE